MVRSGLIVCHTTQCTPTVHEVRLLFCIAKQNSFCFSTHGVYLLTSIPLLLLVSFVRKLHRWGFVRLTSGTGTDCFHHPLFQKGRKDLASKITCTPRDKDGNLKTPHRNMKPPSLAGVERFIRQKADAAVAMAEAKARTRDPDSNESVPLYSTSGLPSSMEAADLPSQLVMGGLGNGGIEGEAEGGDAPVAPLGESTTASV
jgi:hypothetical protein